MTVPTDPTAAARRLAEPDVTPAELAGIARDVPALRAAVAAHPRAYPALREWIAAQGSGPVAEPGGAAVAPSALPAAVSATTPTVPALVAGPTPAARPEQGRRQAALPWVITAVSVVVALVAVGVLVLGDRGGAASSTAAGTERGFATPEEAVEFFADRVGAGDLASALEAFGVATPVEGYSFEYDVERMGAVTPTVWLPASSDGYRAVDVELRRGSIATQMLFLVRALAAPDLDLDVTLTLDDEVTAADVADQLDPAGLEGFAVLRVDELSPTPSGRVDPFEVQAQIFGADEMREVAVLYETSDGPVLGGMQLLRFGDEWHIWALGSAFLGLALGDLEPTSEAAYEAAVADING